MNREDLDNQDDETPNIPAWQHDLADRILAAWDRGQTVIINIPPQH